MARDKELADKAVLNRWELHITHWCPAQIYYYFQDKQGGKWSTYIKFVPDPEVFADYAFREGIVKEILHSIARQNKGLSISLNGTIVPDSF